MSLPISPISLPVASSLIQAQPLPATAESSFQNVLESAIHQVEGSRATADTAAQNFVSGTGGELHSTILAAQSSELDFQLFMQVRNKVVSAYEDIMKMQI